MVATLFLGTVLLFTVSTYLVIILSIINHQALWSRVPKAPPAYGQITDEVSPASLHFGKFHWIGSKFRTDPTALKASLRYPGTALFKRVCQRARYHARDQQLCFWVERRSLLISEPYFPAKEITCNGHRQCLVSTQVPPSSRGCFLPATGVAATTIPQAITRDLPSNGSSVTIPYKSKEARYVWVRSFHWKYEGTFVLGSRPFQQFNFTYAWPALLPSGIPNIIFGLCTQETIKANTCALITKGQQSP